MRYWSLLILYILIVCLPSAFAWDQMPELFDLSGIPDPPASFTEQQILEMISGHKPGDLADAARIQQKLAAYYRDKRDLGRSEAAEARARAAAGSLGKQEAPTSCPTASSRVYGNAAAPECRTPGKYADGGSRQEAARREQNTLSRVPETLAPSRKPAFSGRYYGYEGRTLHTWDFNPDGTFLHTSIAAGVGTSVRSSEKGTFRMLGQYLELALASGATGFTAPAVGGRGAVVGGAADRMAEVRRLRIEFQSPGQGILLDGISMKVKSW